jgi:PAS domain S-box-containing protein
MRNNTSRNANLAAKLLTQAAMTAPWGFAVTDHQRRDNPIVFVNQAFEVIIGHEADEALGKSWRCLLGSDPESHSLARIREAVRQGSPCSVVLQSSGKDGARLHNELAVAPMLNRSRNVTHLTWLCRDITSRVEREARLASTLTELEERLSAYLEITAEAFWRLDFEPPIRLDLPESQQVQEIFRNGVFREIDDAGARIYGLSKGAEVIGQPLRAFMDPSDPKNVKRVAEYVRNGFRMKNLISYEKDVAGTTHIVLNNIAPRIEDGQVRYILGASLDVTEHFEASQALEHSRKELAEKAAALETKNAALGELISHIELDKKDFQDRIAANIEHVLLPSLDRIRAGRGGAAYIEQHRQALEDLMSSFGRRIADAKLKLTPREVEVCYLVKNGLTSKDIAHVLKIAVHTVEKHRRTARNKLDLANKGINLRTYLNSM